MTICLYGSPISTFARKVAIGLDLKELQYDLVDALTPDRREELRKLNPRLEVPVLTDGDLVIVNSSDILQYLDWRYPEQPLYPAKIEERVLARTFERPINASIRSSWTAHIGAGPIATTSRRRVFSKQASGTSTPSSTASNRCLARARNPGRFRPPGSSSARGLPISPPCARSALRSIRSVFRLS